VSGESEVERTKNPLCSQPLTSPIPCSMKAILLQAGGLATVNVSTIGESSELRYIYRCNHCGHEWSEKKVMSFESKLPSDYRED
jgi:hypothetical protein